MKNILIYLITLCGFVGCNPCYGFSKKPPVSIEVEKPEPSPSPVEKPEVVDAYAGRELLFNIATKDVCSKFQYGGNQGQAPAAYLKGLVLTYVKTICAPDSDVFKIGSQPLGDASKDALAHYGLKPQSPSDRLNTTFALMIGSNARESSWRPCVGRDVAAKASDVKGCLYGSGATCEAGLAQTSYNSVPASGPLRDLFDAYADYPNGCFKTEYYGKTTCSAANWKNHGSDPKALQFQTMSKECPGYTVESGVIMFRTKRTHYGPLNKKTAEVVPACVAMFERVRQEVLKNPNLCYVL